VKKSAEVIVNDLRYKPKGGSVEVERNDCLSHPTIEVIIEGLNFKLLQIFNGCSFAKWRIQALRKRNRENELVIKANETN